MCKRLCTVHRNGMQPCSPCMVKGLYVRFFKANHTTSKAHHVLMSKVTGFHWAVHGNTIFQPTVPCSSVVPALWSHIHEQVRLIVFNWKTRTDT